MNNEIKLRLIQLITNHDTTTMRVLGAVVTALQESDNYFEREIGNKVDAFCLSLTKK